MAQIITLLQTIYPARDATDVPLNTKINLVFGHDMQTSSLSEKTIVLKTVSEQIVDVSYTYDRLSKTLTLDRKSVV